MPTILVAASARLNVGKKVDLPISRPYRSRRRHVVADSQELDLWLRDGAAWRRRNSELIARPEHSQQNTRRCRKHQGRCCVKHSAFCGVMSRLNMPLPSGSKNLIMRREKRSLHRLELPDLSSGTSWRMTRTQPNQTQKTAELLQTGTARSRIQASACSSQRAQAQRRTG